MLDRGHETQVVVPETLTKMLPILDSQKQPVIKVGLFLTLYFRNAHLEKTRNAVLGCVTDFFNLWEQQIQWGILGVGKPSSIESFPEHASQTYLSSVDIDSEDGWQIYWHSDSPTGASDFGFQAFGNSREQCEQLGHLSYLTVHFPITGPSCGPKTLLELCQRWCEQLQPVHGYGGLGVIHAADQFVAAKYEKEEYALAMRFPALEVDYPLEHALWTRDGIKGGNWITVLSEQWESQLKKANDSHPLTTPFKTLPYPGGIIIQSGESLGIADKNRGNKTLIYNKLAGYLHSIRVKTHPAIHSSQGQFSRQAFEDWLARFDD